MTENKLPIIGHERALIDRLTKALHSAARREGDYTTIRETRRGNYFEVRVGETGRIARVTVELDRIEATPGDEKPTELRTVAHPQTRTVAHQLNGEPRIIHSESTRCAMCEPESMVWTVDLGGGMESPDGDAAAAHQRMVDSWVAAAAEKIVAWVNANGGEARYVPLGEDTPIGWSGYPRIAVRTAYGWAHMKPGDRIVKGHKLFQHDHTEERGFKYLTCISTFREFAVSPVESSGSAE